MWILKGCKGEEYYLTTNKVHVVSRKTHGNIVLADDESVSRTHAKVEVSFDKEHVDDPAVLPDVFLVECSSKYGTYVNKGISTNSRLPEGTRLQLKDGDRIRFGIQHNEWRLQHVPLVTTTSTLNAEQKLSLSEVVTELGGHMVADWRNDCTHVTMNKITLTVKVVCALARGRQIVAPEYWQLYLSAATSKSELPDYTNHIPPLAERSLSSSNVSFAVDERRASLFRGKLFVFHSIEQHNAFSCMVFAAGGVCVIADGCGMSNEEMLAPHVIVMAYPFERGSQETQFNESFKELKRFLMSNGKRLISESEIGLAVLHCSTERYCNPQFSTETASVSQSQSALSRNTIMKVTQEASEPRKKVQNTESSQDSFPSLRTKTRNRIHAVIVESDSETSGPELEIVPTLLNKMSDDETDKLNAESGETCSKKRLRSAVDNVENPSKKLATETSNLSKLHTVQVHVASSSKMKNVASSNSSEVNIFTTESAARETLFSESRQGRNDSFVSHSSVVAKRASRRISESSDEEESLFSFVGDPRKPATKRRNDSENEGRPTFTFVDKGETNHTTGRKGTVRNNSDSDEDDYNAATKFAFVEDPSTKFAETYFPDKAWATSTKRGIQEVGSNDSSLDEPPPKRQSVETSRNTTSRVVDLVGFISTVKIKDEDVENSYIAGLPDYVVAMNNTVIVTVGATVINKNTGQNSSINGKNSLNFKKFKKVNPVRQNIVPTIIGGSDLVVAQRYSECHAVNGDVAGRDDRHETTFHFVDD